MPVHFSGRFRENFDFVFWVPQSSKVTAPEKVGVGGVASSNSEVGVGVLVCKFCF